MAVIRVLDKHTAELIAAGEVVERPASVVKELMENSIDAGASHITVTIEAGGIKLIEVSDNGSGIEAEYVPTAFIRHATSKIATQQDLDSIHTLGFRGEALASIASVARVELLTRTAQDEFACQYCIEGGEAAPIQPGARGVGTTIRVRDLFYNTPARMKFLKKDSSEGTFVADVVARLALSHPEISFRFVREGKVQYVTPGDGNLMNTAYAVLGREFARGMLAVEDTNGQYRVHGLITPPRQCRASRSMQHFYINGRYVKNRTMMAALETAFKGVTMQGRFPGAVLMLTMPPQLVDVNVHPAKTEVRFARENDVFDVVYHSVKLALAQPGSGEQLFAFAQKGAKTTPGPAAAAQAVQSKLHEKIAKTDEIQQENTVKQGSFTGVSAVVAGQAEPGALPARPLGQSDAQPALPGRSAGLPAAGMGAGAGKTQPAQPLPTVIPAGAPLRTSVTLHSSAAGQWQAGFAPAPRESALDILPGQVGVQPAAGRQATKTPEDLPPAGPAVPPKQTEAAAGAAAAPPAQTSLYPQQQLPPLQYVGEVFRTYLIAQRGDELCLIDKHAAHERQLYEKLAAGYGNVPSQMLLAPLTVELSAEEKQAVLENLPLLENAGLEVGDFGGRTLLLRAVPADVQPDDAAALLEELAAKLARGSRDALSERTEWVLHSIACRAAVKAGDRTSPQELMALAEKILCGQIPPYCPHGRPCVLKLTRKELEKQFGRIV